MLTESPQYIEKRKILKTKMQRNPAQQNQCLRKMKEKKWRQ